MSEPIKVFYTVELDNKIGVCGVKKSFCEEKVLVVNLTTLEKTFKEFEDLEWAAEIADFVGGEVIKNGVYVVKTKNRN